jgi:excisionase family DNA binding protein
MKGYLTATKTAERLGVTSARVKQMVLQGTITAEKLGKDIFIPASEVERVRQLELRITGPAATNSEKD